MKPLVSDTGKAESPSRDGGPRDRVVPWKRCTRIIGAWEQPSRPARTDAIGYGKVTAVEADRLDIIFDKAGEKRVLDRYVEMA